MPAPEGSWTEGLARGVRAGPAFAEKVALQ